MAKEINPSRLELGIIRGVAGGEPRHLAAEVVVQHPLVAAAPAGAGIAPSPGGPPLRELGGGGGHNALSGPAGVAGASHGPSMLRAIPMELAPIDEMVQLHGDG